MYLGMLIPTQVLEIEDRLGLLKNLSDFKNKGLSSKSNSEDTSNASQMTEKHSEPI